ncbi:hypothetical protein [Brevundimonas sp.]|uniref:hypothetical protein n=1 Tax=Brevundimonas sp. TaxID=1871086 RepID=UPI003F714F4A
MTGDLEAPDADAKTAREQRDLEAQEAMALWSARMFWATAASVLLSGVGVVLIFLTFRESRRGAEAADLMAGEAAKSTLAAIKAADIAEAAQKSNEKQMRAYVVVCQTDNVDLVAGQRPAVQYTMINRGVTPALDVRVFVCGMEADDAHTAAIKFRPKSGKIDLGAGQASAQTERSDVAVTQAQVDALMQGRRGVVFAIYIRYRDIFGRTHRTIARMFLDPAVLQNGNGPLAYGRKGNRVS